MSNKTNVTSLVNFDDVDVSNLREGIRTYSTIARQIEKSEGSVANWVYDVAKMIWKECDMMSEIALKTFTEKLEAEVVFITSDAAGGAKLKASQAQLKGNNPLANAYKRVKNGFIKNLDLNDFSSISALAMEVARLNKEAADALKIAKTETQIADAAVKMAIAEGIDPNSESGKVWVSDKIKELVKKYAEENSPAANSSPTTSVGSSIAYEVPEEYSGDVDSLVVALDKMCSEAIHMYLERAKLGDPSRALSQVMETIEAATQKWLDNALKNTTEFLRREAVEQQDKSGVDDIAV